jgi:hypothetical protein
MSIYDEADDTADEDAENGSKGTETREESPAADPSETDENGRGVTVDVSGLGFDDPPEGAEESPSDDMDGAEDDDGDADGAGAVVVIALLAAVAWVMGQVNDSSGRTGRPPGV